ncbi:Helicase associated domain protein [Streptomyces sp. NPDC005931]|uniref:helicase associated domain-containing protein n=1 Tax=Streptomyces sp. NPDC005931 TaxID=3364737 RepID=UPI0036A26AD9
MIGEREFDLFAPRMARSAGCRTERNSLIGIPADRKARVPCRPGPLRGGRRSGRNGRPSGRAASVSRPLAPGPAAAAGAVLTQHEAAWRSRLAAAADYLCTHGHLVAPATTPVGAWLAEQRHLATKNTLDPPARTPSPPLTPTGACPTGRTGTANTTCCALRLASGADPAALTPGTLLAGVKIGSWLHRRLTTWPRLHPGQQPADRPEPPAPEQSPRPGPPHTPHLRTDRAAPGTLPPPRRPHPRCPRDHPRRRDTVKIDAWLAKPVPSTAPANSPPNTPAWSRRSSTETGPPRTPFQPPCCNRGSRPRTTRRGAESHGDDTSGRSPPPPPLIEGV